MPASRSIFAMQLLVLAAVVAAAVADVSHLAGLYNPPASSYGVPQNSVTENFLRAVPTSPPSGLNLPAFEHQDFKSQLSVNPSFQFSAVSTTPASNIDLGHVSSTSAPSVDPIVSTTPAPGLVGGFGLGSGYSYTTPVPDLGLNSGFQNFVSSTPAPNVVLTSGSQELLSAQPPNFGFNALPTQAPNLFSTAAPLVSTTQSPILDSGLNFGAGLNFQSFPNFDLNAYSTPLPFVGGGGLPPFDGGLSSFDGGLNVHSLHSATLGGSLNDAFGVSSGPVVSAPSQEAEVSKHVYFFDAPEDPDPPRLRVNVAPVPPPKKNVRILFIKAPAPPAPAPIRIAAPPQNEEKTIVYVLVKKPEEQQDIEIQPPPATAPTKPEVFFIRYKNHQEAEQAISQVQNDQSNGQVIPDTINGAGDVIINREGPVTPFPIFNNYIQSTTTAAPPINLGGPLIGPGFDTGFVNPQLENDINTNLISSGARTSSLFSTGAPVTVSTSEIGLLGTSTIAPVEPHVTYGPPIFKK